MIERIEDTNDAEDTLYEKDPRFIEYMRLLVDHSKDERNLVSSERVFAGIKEKYGWS